MPPTTKGISHIEILLAKGGKTLLLIFFRRWPPDALYRLSRTNFNLHYGVRMYIQIAWDPINALKRWFIDPEKLLRSLHATNAILSGPFVMKFFDRDPRPVSDVDICVRIDGLLRLGNELIRQGFLFTPADGDHKRFDITTLMQSGRKSFVDTSYTTGPVSRLDPLVRSFRFVRCTPHRDGTMSTSRVAVNLVRWDPWRYILCAESTAVMNMITGTHAIAIFPRHSFIERKALNAGQDNPKTDDLTRRWLSDYAGDDFTRLSQGDKIIQNLTVGKRRVGDRLCWTIRFAAFQLVSSIPNPEIHGPVFEVLDWTSRTPKEGAYLRIADPFVWSSWAYLRGFIPKLYS